MSFSDSGDDFDDILQSDDDVPKKPKPSAIIEPEKDKEIKTEAYHFHDSPVEIKEKKSNKLLNDKLFDNETDHFSSLDIGKQKDGSNKPAKAILNSLLNPSKELNDIDFLFNKSQSQSNMKNNSEYKHSDDIFDKEYRPSTGNPKQKDSIINSTNKRTVRFSTETLGDDFNFDSSSLQSRPVTAPNVTPSDTSKHKFVSRFEAAEFDDNPVTLSSFPTSKSGSDSSLWRDSKPDFVNNVTGMKSKMEVKENKPKESSRQAPKEALTDFLQVSHDEVLSGFDKPRAPNFNNSVPVNITSNTRRNSMEDLLDSNKKTDSFDEFNPRRRTSVSQVLSFDRPKTSHSRHDKTQSKYDDTDAVDPSHHDNPEFQLKIKCLENEKNGLLYKIEQMTKRNAEELEMNEKLFKNRIEILEENIQSKEKRLKEEIELLAEQNKQKLKMIEKERLEMRSELSRRQDELENQKRQEISRLREQHKLELEKVKLDHNDLIERLKNAKTEEDATLRLVQPTTVQLQSVLTQMSNGAQDLSLMKQQLMEQFNQQIKEKDTQLKEKNEYLRQLEENLAAQKDENIKERERLQSLIAKLDIQLKEQSRATEEERWFLRQEQNKLSALQSSLDKEREQILIERDQNRLSHEEFRKKLLDEQKQMLEQIYEEKRNMADERAKLTREMCKWSESNQLSNLKKNQETAELDGMRAALLEEKRELDRVKIQLATDREELQMKTSKLETTNYDVKMKTERLTNLERELNLKQTALNEKEQHYREIEARSEEAFRKAKELHSSHDDQISKVQRQLKALNDKEQQVTKQLMKMEEVRTELQKEERTMVCNKCSGYLRKDSVGGSYNSLNKLPPAMIGRKDHDVMNYNGFGPNFNHEMKHPLEYSSLIASQMEEERLIYSIKQAADNDREFLSQERAYLDSLVAGSQSSWKTHIHS